MNGKIAVDKLKEHPKNKYYFTDLEAEKYEEVKRSIEVNGIRDPIKCTTSYTVISGHQRLRMAKELGLQEVPVQIVDVDEWEAEYLLIAENVERRGQAETDPMKKSRIANFLKEYWGVRDGNNQHTRVRQNGEPSKTTNHVADFIGEGRRNTERLIKLNDLIPELQQLISDGKIGTTAGEQLAHLTEEEQRALLSVKGELLANTTVQEAKDYRKEASTASQTNTGFAEHLQKIEQENRLMKQEIAELKNRKQEIVEKVIDNTDYEKIEQLNKRLEAMSGQVETARVEKQEILNKLQAQEERTKEYNELKKELDKKDEELLALTQEQLRMKDKRMIYSNASRMTQEVGKWTRQIRMMILERGHVDGDQEVYNTLQAVIQTLDETKVEVQGWIEAKPDPNNNHHKGGEIVDAEFVTVD